MKNVKIFIVSNVMEDNDFMYASPVASRYIYIYIYIYISCPVPVVRYFSNMKVRRLHIRSFCRPIRPGSAHNTFDRKFIFYMKECLLLLCLCFSLLRGK